MFLKVPVWDDTLTKQQRTSTEFWESYIQLCISRLLKDENLMGRKLRIDPPKGGTHPAFVVERRVVVKFYKQKHGDLAFETERTILTTLTQHNVPNTPHLLAYGSLQELIQGSLSAPCPWRWPFIIMTAVCGTTLSHQWNNMTEQHMKQLIKQLAPKVRELHQLKPARKTTIPRLQPDGYVAFLRHQLLHYKSKHAKWNELPPHLYAQLEDYLPPSYSDLYSHTPIHERVGGSEGEEMAFSLVHGDLHDSNILVSIDKDNQLKLEGLIDLGDVIYGDPLYDLIVLHINTFHANKRLLKFFLKTYGWVIDDMETFVYRCMCLTLLNEYNRLRGLDLSGIATLDELAHLLWDLNDLDSGVSSNFPRPANMHLVDLCADV